MKNYRPAKPKLANFLDCIYPPEEEDPFDGFDEGELQVFEE